MKRMKIIIPAFCMLLCLVSCADLDLNPLSETSTGNFYSTQQDLEMAVNDLYRSNFYYTDDDLSTDDMTQRTISNAIVAGTITADWSLVELLWTNCYKAIARANSFLRYKNQAEGNTNPDIMLRLEAEVRFIRAYEYSLLVARFGDVPFITDYITLEESYKYKRSDKRIVLDFIYEELDWAANNLPVSYAPNLVQRFTKGAALAIKARTALYAGDWDIASAAAKAVMDIAATGAYQLHPDYYTLFLPSGQNNKEVIMSSVRSETYGVINAGSLVLGRYLTRNAGFTCSYMPTRELMDSYECTDGLPIDESPLYNHLKPFNNRDPRLEQTILKHGSDWLQYRYQPHPDSTRVMSYKDGRKVSNKDSRGVDEYASYTGLVWKKGFDQTMADRKVDDTDVILVRYAEMLLTYAEAKIEMNEIDVSVLNAINQVRARAYKTTVDNVANYPAVTTTDQETLRTLIKRERRVEFAREGLRYMDLIRWRIAEYALKKPVLGIPDPEKQDRNKWPFPGVPVIDKNGIPDYSAMINDCKVLGTRNFNEKRQYLWPIPGKELLVNPNMMQNEGY
ncbi:MAG: RagB/SusD family nutrient uptake outer membrane protein [Paludibacter sp.]|nr:RagB/SusD family nutrient uptake outer membrane protein [Paludibacter sp.]